MKCFSVNDLDMLHQRMRLIMSNVLCGKPLKSGKGISRDSKVGRILHNRC